MSSSDSYGTMLPLGDFLCRHLPRTRLVCLLDRQFPENLIFGQATFSKNENLIFGQATFSKKNFQF